MATTADPTATPPRAPYPAASVILLREPRVGIEVLMLRRRRGSSFMASACVFPGGGVDPGETLEACAARELFEEAGVALLREPRGGAELVEARARLASGEPIELPWDEAALAPWAHWVTPSLEPKRFAAQFFVAALPAGQEPRFDDLETVEQVWVAPETAAARAAELALPPPQLRTLWELTSLRSIEEVLAAAAERAEEAHSILPRLSQGDGASPRCLLLPWDPEYLERGLGEALPMASRPRWARGPSRFVLEDRAWRHLEAPGSTTAG